MKNEEVRMENVVLWTATASIGTFVLSFFLSKSKIPDPDAELNDKQ
jgi:hypothetical protein